MSSHQTLHIRTDFYTYWTFFGIHVHAYKDVDYWFEVSCPWVKLKFMFWKGKRFDGFYTGSELINQMNRINPQIVDTFK